MLEIGPDDESVLRNLPPIYVDVLLRLPEILRDDQADVRERLFPMAYPGDADKEAEWSRYARPDLEVLFEDRIATMQKDLQHRLTFELATEEGVGPVPFGFCLTIPAAHRTAWIAGLNAARLALAVRHGVEAEDMDPWQESGESSEAGEPTDKDLAILQIELLGHLQGMLLREVEPDVGDDGVSDSA